MFKGTKVDSNSNYQPMMGLAAFKLIAVNPNHQWLTENVSQNFPEPNYSIREDFNQNKVRNINLWFRNEEHNITTSMILSVGMTPNKTQSGKTQFINALGQFKYAESIEECNEKYPDFNAVRPAYEGEYELTTLIQRIIKYKPSSEGAQYLEDAKSNGVDVETLYDGEYDGFNKFIQEYNHSNIGLVLSVKETKKEVDGETKLRYRQTIITKPEAFFTCFKGIDDYHLNRLKTLIDEKQTSGFSLSNDFYTIKLTPFDVSNPEASKALCINTVPANPAPATAGWSFK